MAGASATLRQSANWCALFEGFPPLARVMNWIPAPMQKGVFLGFFHKELSSGQWNYMFRGMLWKCFQVMSLLTGHGMNPPIVRDGDCRDGDKLLCNRCPLKHEARKREGWNALRERVQLKTLPSENLCREVQLISQIHDICGMGAAIHNRVYNNPDPRYGHSHPVRIDK